MTLRKIAGRYLVIFLLSGCYPEMAEVEAKLDKISTLKQSAERLNEYLAILERIRSPDDAAKEKVVKYVVQRLATTYVKTEDPTIPDAIDHMELQGAFGNHMCSFYGVTDNIPAMKKRNEASLSARTARIRCNGVV